MTKRLIFFVILFSLSACLDDKKSPTGPAQPPPPPTEQNSPVSSPELTFNGGDSSGGAIINYEPPPHEYATEDHLKASLKTMVRRQVWAFFTQADTDPNFPFVEHIKNKMHQIQKILLTRMSFELVSEHCKNQWGQPAHASIWPTDKRHLICVSIGELVKKKILLSETSKIIGSVVAHEVSHLIGLETETEAQTVERYYVTMFDKFKNESLILGNPHWVFMYIQEVSLDASRITGQQYQKHWVNICSSLKNYLNGMNLVGGAIFSPLEKDYLAALRIKAAYDYMNTCDVAWLLVREDAMPSSQPKSTLTFAEAVERLGILEDLKFPRKYRELPQLPLQDFNDAKFLSKTMDESKDYMNRILYFTSSITSCDIYPTYGIFSNCTIQAYKYNSSLPLHVFVPWSLPDADYNFP